MVTLIDEEGENYDVHRAFFGGLSYLQELRTKKEDEVRTQLRNVDMGLEDLFGYAKERIVNGGTGRDSHLPGKLEDMKAVSGSEAAGLIAPSCVQNTDLAHTIACLDYAFSICGSLKLDDNSKKIVLSALTVHDCAYPKVNSYEEFTNPENRAKHMENAVYEFTKWADLINNNFSREVYNNKDIKRICRLAGNHDNPSLKKDYDYSDLKNLVFAHAESDRLWMLDFGGFALDLLREIAEKQVYNPQARLDYVISKHKKEQEHYTKFRDEIRLFENNPTLYRTDKGIHFFREAVNKLKEDYGLR